VEEKKPSGFYELPHTADWAILVWGEDFESLLNQAVAGMYALMQVHLGTDHSIEREFYIEAQDHEGVLVGALNEILFLGESENIGCQQIFYSPKGEIHWFRVKCAPIHSRMKDIKAVTFHNLAIRERQGGIEVSLIFDV
jgi:SHS2 domain-containing protein